MNYMNGANTPIGSSPGTNLIYGSSPKTAASGWIEYTTTAGRFLLANLLPKNNNIKFSLKNKK